MKFRTLRNAFLCLCFASCLLPVGLWYRSYIWSDTVYLSGKIATGYYLGTPNDTIYLINNTNGHHLTFHNGRIYFDEDFSIRNGHGKIWQLRLPGFAMQVVTARSNVLMYRGAGLSVPYWLIVGAMVTLTAGFAAAPGLTFRFSLRAILMLITFIALLLGAMHYILRSDTFNAANAASGVSYSERSSRSAQTQFD